MSFDVKYFDVLPSIYSGLTKVLYLGNKVTVWSVFLFCVHASTYGIQAASEDEAEKYERTFILQLLSSDGSSTGKEVLFLNVVLLIFCIEWSCQSFMYRSFLLGCMFMNIDKLLVILVCDQMMQMNMTFGLVQLYGYYVLQPCLLDSWAP